MRAPLDYDARRARPSKWGWKSAVAIGVCVLAALLIWQGINYAIDRQRAAERQRIEDADRREDEKIAQDRADADKAAAERARREANDTRR